MNNNLYEQAKSLLYYKLRNVLRGDAATLKDNTGLTVEERRERMKAIEDFLVYIQSYDKNQQLLKEYEELKMRMINDGR